MIKTTELNLKKKLYFLVVLLKDEENKMNMNSLNSIQIELYRELNKSQDKLELINQLKLEILEIITKDNTISKLEFSANDIFINLPNATANNKFEFSFDTFSISYKDNFMNEPKIIKLK